MNNTSRGNGFEQLTAGVLGILRGIKPQQPRVPIAEVMLETLQKASVAEGIARYRTLKATKAAEYELSEEQLNGVGYHLLRSGRVADALEVFKLNVEMFPTRSNPYDSLGEAYLGRRLGLPRQGPRT